MNVLEIKNLTVSYRGDTPALDNLSIDFKARHLYAIAGPNGGGKTTLIKSALGLIKPQTGSVYFFGGAMAEHRKRIAYIPQRSSVDWDFPVSVKEVVLMGRYAHIGLFARPSDSDYIQAYGALEKVGMLAYADRHINDLSGGQQQRVFFARALVQEADILLLDEPFVGIDVATERLIISLLKVLCKEGKTVLIVHHDIQTLIEYFDWVLLLNRKKIAFGPVDQVCMPEYICAAYGGRTLYVPRQQ